MSILDWLLYCLIWLYVFMVMVLVLRVIRAIVINFIDIFYKDPWPSIKYKSGGTRVAISIISGIILFALSYTYLKLLIL